jgi:hypothetical protein
VATTKARRQGPTIPHTDELIVFKMKKRDISETPGSVVNEGEKNLTLVLCLIYVMNSTYIHLRIRDLNICVHKGKIYKELSKKIK